MIEFLLSLFKPRSVNAIVSDFTKAMNQLDETRAYQLKAADQARERADAELKKAEAAKVEAARAQTIRDNINSLLG